MLAIGFRFPGGRYHATPWGRHVNEADVEWPPSPWRILRALVAVWHCKADHSRHSRKGLEDLLGRLAESLPVYRLPPGIHSHVRHYMPVREGSRDRNTMIFDAFARISPDEEMLVIWPQVTLQVEEEKLLDDLLSCLGYLGRAESWVEARRLQHWQAQANCIPEESAEDLEETGERSEIIPLMCPVTPTEYRKHHTHCADAAPASKRKAKGKRTGSDSSLPESWLNAMCMETSELQAAGWSHPPAARRVWYRRPADILLPAARNAATRLRYPKATVTTTVRFALYGRPLPMLEDAVRIGELARAALMHVMERHLGQVPTILSGHDLPAGNRHGHAFFLPEFDPRGRIDHLLVHAAQGFDRGTLLGMQNLRRLYRRDGTEWEVWYEGAGAIGDFLGRTQYTAFADTWRSVTPYLRPWHTKKRFGIAEQIHKECCLRELPEPVMVRILPEVMVGSRPRRPVHFHRFRSKRGLLQPDTQGCFPEIIFSEAISGPLALGFGCHYGLGLFVPSNSSAASGVTRP